MKNEISYAEHKDCMPFYISAHIILQKTANKLEKQPQICYNIVI